MRAENRRRGLTPDPLPPASHMAIRLGFLGTFSALSIASVMLVRMGRSPWFLLLAFPGLLAFCRLARESVLILRAWRWAERTGRAGVLVTSDSPHWCAYIDANWLPILGDRVSVLNWSHHTGWRPTIETALFEMFAGRKDYCPAIMVVRRHGGPSFASIVRSGSEARERSSTPPARGGRVCDR